MKIRGSKIFFLILVLLLATAFFVLPRISNASDNVVINEIMYGKSGQSKNEFIELYNPSDSDINLEEYKLTKKTKSGSESNLVSLAKFSGTIHSQGYFLITHPDYKDEYNSDLAYSGSSYSIAADNTVILYDSSNNIVDKIGYGEASDFEGAVAIDPGDNKSLERKDNSDTDNNFNDFFIQEIPSPRSSFQEEDDEVNENNSEEDESNSSEETFDYSGELRLNEIFPNPEGKDSGREFIEIYNYSDKEIDLKGWKIKDKKNSHSLDGSIDPGSYKVFYKTVSINNSDEEISLVAPGESEIDKVSFSKSKENYSFSYFEGSWYWSKNVTPGKKNIVSIEFGKSVRINEILPNPKKDEEKNEYIELYNYGKKDIKLEDWVIKDSSKGKGYVFLQKTLKPGEYWTIYRKKFKFALNNSGAETISLYNSEDELISSINYSGSKEGVSYNFNQGKWKWSRFLTPGKKNKLNHAPKAAVELDKKIYKQVYADFEVSGKDSDGDKLKFTWDFGDGHRSYKNITRHKYEKTGKYKVTLKIFDGSDEVIKIFSVDVKEFPSYKGDLEFISLLPNPKGKDEEAEQIIIKSNSKNSISLEGWSIATGSENLYNHPILNDIKINPEGAATLTRKDSRFTLGNKKLEIELRSPSGEVVDELSYNLETSAEEDAIYQKTEEGWKWIKKENDEELAQVESDQISEENQVVLAEIEEAPKILGAEVKKSDENVIVNPEERGFFSYLFWLLNQKINQLIGFFISLV